jgi:hypothetical protein
MSRWGDRWLAGEAGPPINFHHHTCDQDVHADVVCSGCGEQLRAEDTSMRMGPGYPAKIKQHPEVKRRFPDLTE